jgi:enoyl-CoA hydratase/carnithine racemase
MVDRVVEDLAAETGRLASAIAAGPPGPIADIKRALRAAERNDIRAQLDLEAGHQLRAFRSRDAAEGMAAFFEKRTPAFRGL